MDNQFGEVDNLHLTTIRHIYSSIGVISRSSRNCRSSLSFQPSRLYQPFTLSFLLQYSCRLPVCNGHTRTESANLSIHLVSRSPHAVSPHSRKVTNSSWFECRF